MKKLPPIIILAGGKAKRLRPITKKIPKSMVLINKKPFIEYQIDQLKKYNFEKILISTGYKSRIIENYIKNKKNVYTIKVIKDKKAGIGTGAAIKNCLRYVKKNFFVIYGDSYLNIDYTKVYKKFLDKKNNVLLTCLKNQNNFDKSNLLILKKKIIEYNKNSIRAKHIDYGFLCFNKKVFKNIAEKKFDLEKIIQKQITQNDISFFLTKNRFYEIGNKKSLKEFRNYIKDK